MKINEILKEENIGNEYTFFPDVNCESDKTYVLLKPFGQPELFAIGYEGEERIEDEYYLKTLLEGEFVLIKENKN